MRRSFSSALALVVAASALVDVTATALHGPHRVMRTPQLGAAAAPQPAVPSGRRLGAVAAPAALLMPTSALAAATEAAEGLTFEPRGITTEDTVIFVIGCVPFVWAGIEFWRRIAVGDPFGTGQDSVIINDSSGNRPSPVRRVLGQDAIIAARILFGLAFASGVLVLIAGADVLQGTV